MGKLQWLALSLSICAHVSSLIYIVRWILHLKIFLIILRGLRDFIVLGSRFTFVFLRSL